ncbi:TIGR04326 family surface carbohydrate biosynthesis protein [Desulfovibrio legallii]|uniref:Surface carbohydrate biosynthesis protein, LIC13510 family n=1 Tax=Desulfovibrio legallii TaxID=571438 RepID=A0A1G7PXQ4_9BACT|nr:TIGR04326 family surface carbohydrate biosynthesis protein [Desulfovibrio legallii]SDF91036.1 surface carbohydrate biosynthesis protein, LIC13510 family [Desulfovibrio legallii]
MELELVVAAVPAPRPQPCGRECCPEGGPERLVVHWEGWEAPEGEYSLPALLRRDLLHIRAEHAAWAYELGLLDAGGRSVQERLTGGAPLSLWWCSLLYERHPKMTPGLYEVYKLRALERFMDARGVTALRCSGGDARLRRVLEALCAAGDRSFAAAGPETDAAFAARPGLLRRCYAACPAPLRAAARYVHWWWTVRRLLPACPLPSAPAAGGAPRQTATIATYFPNVDMEAARQGRFRSRYWESLHEALNAAAQAEGGHFVRWLFIRFPAPQLSLRQCLELRDRFRQSGRDGCSFHYLEELLRPRDLVAAAWRYVRICLSSLLLERAVRPAFHLPGSRLNFWDYLGPYWAESFRGWRALERCLQLRACERYAAAAGPQRWTLFPLENCPWERMLTTAVHRAGNGPVVGAQHSTIRPTDFRYFDDPRAFTPPLAVMQPDQVRANGGSALAQWRDAGLPAARLDLAEALRYLYLVKDGTGTAAAAGAPPTTPTSQDATPRRLLAVTSFFADETDAHLRLLARALLGGLLEGWEVCVKPHPYLPVAERLQALLGARAAEVRVLEGPIGPLLAPGVLVWASNSTTAALEAVLKGLPVLVMLPTNDFDLCPLQDVPGLPRTGSLEDVKAALAAAAPLALPDGYLDLDPALPRWKHLLNLVRMP